MRNKTPITSVENLDSVLEILKVLIREGIQQAQGYPGGPVQRRAQETEETIEEQGWLARIVHLLQGKDNDTQFKVSFGLVSRESGKLTWCLASSIRTQSILGRQ
jgi:vacuolar protein sorting-associated protein 35